MTPIGGVRYSVNGQAAEAVMTDRGRWRCADQTTANLLNIYFAVRDYSPSHGEYGSFQIHEAAEYLKGEPFFTESDEPEPEGDVVY